MPRHPKTPPTRDQLAAFNEDMLFMDDYDHCLIGVASRYGMPNVAAYNLDKVIATLMHQGMSRDQACEFFAFNQLGSWVGEFTPIFVTLLTHE